MLGALESAVLAWMWQHGNGATRELHGSVGAQRGITLSTIQSTVERLHRKGLLRRERVGHAYRYAPSLSRAEFRARALERFTEDLEGPDASGVLAAFVDLVARARGRRLDELARLVEAARMRRPTRPPRRTR